MAPSHKRDAMPLLLLLFPLAEIATFILVGGAIGVLRTLGLVIVSSVIGGIMLRDAGIMTALKLQRRQGNQAAILADGEFPRAALAAALTYAMIYEQPVVYELPRLAPRTLLIIGQADRTALGKAQMAPAVRALAGDYPRLGRATRDAIPHADLLELPGVGHIPHVQAPAAFDRAVLAFLKP